MSDPHLEHARIALRKWAFERNNRKISTILKNSTAESGLVLHDTTNCFSPGRVTGASIDATGIINQRKRNMEGLNNVQ